MTIYFDQNNFESFLQARQQPGYADVERMLTRQVGLHFNFAKEALRTGPVAIQYAAFIKMLSWGQKDNPVPKFADTYYPDRPIAHNVHTRFERGSRPVLLLEDERAGSYRDAGACLVGEVGQEVEVLNRLQKPGGDYEFETKLYLGEPEFRSWEQLQPYCLPCYDVIISDRYLLLADDATIRANYLKLLESLLYERRIKVNVVLIALRSRKEQTATWSYETLKKLTKSTIEGKTGKTPNFTLVWANDPKTVRHDRHVITNYQWFQSGDTLNFFSAAGATISEGDSLTINSLARADHRRGADIILNRFQTRIDNVKRLNPDAIQGDRASSFLTF